MASDISKTFEEVYKDQSDAIFRFCLVRVSNRAQAMDITQETFLRLWKSLQDKQEIINSRAFLFTICHRLIIDWYRKKKSFSLDGMLEDREEESGSTIEGMATEDSGELRAEGRYLLEKIQELPKTYRDPVYLRFVEGLSPGEIGDILGIEANAASVRINRGLKELREIAGYNEEE